MEVVNKPFVKELYNRFGFIKDESTEYHDKSLYIQFIRIF